MLLKTGALSLILLLVSRMLGFVRESAQAAAFGTTGMGDVAVLMLTLPDWLTGVIAGGALTYVLLPHWASQTPDHQAKTQRRVALWLLLSGTALAAAFFVLKEPMAQMLLNSMPRDLLPQAARRLAFSVLTLPAAMLAAMWVIRLQHEMDFIGMFSANLVVNCVVIGGLLLIATNSLPIDALGLLAISVWLAMGLRLVWLRTRLDPRGVEKNVLLTREVPMAMPHTRLWLWAALCTGLPMTLPFVARTFASGTGEGALATFNYAWKLVELPLVLAIQLVATLVFPTITRAMNTSQRSADGLHEVSQDAIEAVRGALLLAWTLACAATTGLQVGANAVATLMFGWGRMPPESVATVAAWSKIGAWSLLPQALIAVALTALATLGRMRRAAAAYGLALLILLAVGVWSNGSGAMMMGALTGALTLVAIMMVLELRKTGFRDQQHACLLPWRKMMTPTLTMLLFTMAARMGWMESLNLKNLSGVAISVLSALVVVAISYLASQELRAELRR